MKFWENCEKFLKKFKRNWQENFNWFQENDGNIIGKTEVIRNWCWQYYDGILKSFSEVISVKSKKLEILKKYRKHFAQTFKKNFDGNFVIFSMQFWEGLAKNYGNFK